MTTIALTTVVLSLVIMVAAFALDRPGGVLVGVLLFVAGCIVGMVGDTLSAERAEQAFMAECTTERKRYECVAMWRAGETGTQVVPVVVPVR